MENRREIALAKHKEWKGKVDFVPVAPCATAEDMAIAYTPGVAEPCLEIQKDENLSYEYTGRGNTIAVISDGTAVLGLGDIGATASMPVMEGKALLFKALGNVNAIPLCINSKDVSEIVRTIKLLEGSFGGINLEDISAPRCFEIEKALKEQCNIPIFHDDQHGTAIVVLAALTNALKLAEKNIADIKIVVNGDGSAGTAITNLIMRAGAKNVVVCNIDGALNKDRTDLDSARYELALNTNPNNESGKLIDVLKGADVFIGVSAPSIVSGEMIKSMKEKSIVLAMANPVPEIYPDEALAAGAYIVGTGRSDFPNQINNVLAFPGLFRGVLDAKATDITEEMKLAAAFSLADMVGDKLSREFILPSGFDKNVSDIVAKAVGQKAVEQGICRK